MQTKLNDYLEENFDHVNLESNEEQFWTNTENELIEMLWNYYDEEDIDTFEEFKNRKRKKIEDKKEKQKNNRKQKRKNYTAEDFWW